MPGTDKEALTIEPWAYAIGLAVLLLAGAMAAFTAHDRAHTAQLESVVTPTAVGDTHFITEPKIGHGPIGLAWQGRNLDMVREDKIRDSKLLQQAMDDTGIYTIYKSDGTDAELPAGTLYMKAAANEFIEITQE